MDSTEQVAEAVARRLKAHDAETEVVRLESRVKALENDRVTEADLQKAENRVMRWLIGTVIAVAILIIGGLTLYANLK